MGLDCSHDAWHGACSAFNRWREKIASLLGINLRAMDGFVDQGPAVAWDALKPDPLHVLLNHSDCDGEIAPEACGPIADRLEALLPLLPEGDGGGHIGNWRETTKRFIDGLREAAANNEPLEFR